MNRKATHFDKAMKKWMKMQHDMHEIGGTCGENMVNMHLKMDEKI